jgi:cytochrome c553
MRKKQLLFSGGLLILVLIPVTLAWGVFPPPTSFWATENVANTKHNLSANQDIKMDPTAGAEICVFCHTPHGANPDSPGAAPLWNRALPPGDQFTAYGANNTAPNFDARGTTPGTPKGVSLACLSCHDGTIAFDALINAPGSGGFQLGNRGTVSDQGVRVLGPTGFQGAIVDNTNSFTGQDRPSGPPSPGTDQPDSSPYTGGLNDFVTDGAGGLSSVGSEPFPNLGRNLQDDHPISMAIPILDPQFDQVRAGAIQDGSIWKLKRQGTGITQDFSTDKRDVVRAYPTAGGTPGGAITTENAYIECASCHNPHTPRPSFLRIPSVDTATQNIPAVTIGGRGVDGDTLPGSTLAQVNTLDQYPNAGSLLCLTCHQK